MIIVAERRKNILTKVIFLKTWLWQVINFKKPVGKIYAHWSIKLNNYLYEQQDGILIKSKRIINKDNISYNVLVDQESIEHLKNEVGKRYTDIKTLKLIINLMNISGYKVKVHGFIKLKHYLDNHFKNN